VGSEKKSGTKKKKKHVSHRILRLKTELDEWNGWGTTSEVIISEHQK
jgi:hypothetical protein